MSTMRRMGCAPGPVMSRLLGVLGDRVALRWGAHRFVHGRSCPGQPGLAVVEPTDLGFGLEDQGVEHGSQATSRSVARALSRV